MALTQVKTLGIADDAVTLAKQAGGTDGQIITFDANGNPTAVGPGTDGQVLTSTGAGAPPAFEAASGGISDVVSDTSPQLGGDLETNGHNILLGDSSNGADDDVIRIGAGQDLNIYHDGTNSWIVNKTGNLNFYAKHGEYACRMIPDGAVELYYDNSVKLETQSTGVRIQDHLHMHNEDRIKLGSSQNFEIYHNGTNAQLDNTTGNLELRNVGTFSSERQLQIKAKVDENSIVCKSDGAVELYYDNSKKLETTSGGVAIVNSLIVDGTDRSAAHASNQDFVVGNTSQAYTGMALVTQDGGYCSIVMSDGQGDKNKGLIAFNHADDSFKFVVDPASGVDTLTLTSDGFVAKGSGGDFYWKYTDKCTLHTDDVKAKFGTGGDLEIFHNATNGNKIMSNNMDIRIGTNNNHTLILGQYYNAAGGGDTCEIWSSGVMPASDDAKDLGETNHRWDDVYATNSSIQTSDSREKDNISVSDLGLSFINKLAPKSYKFKGKTRTHYGLVAQDIETVLSDISKSTADFAGFVKTDNSEAKDGSSYRYGLRYGEFIAPLIKAVQELSTKVAALEAK